jgi:vanillate O-demethylase ferredoxin subunit
MSATLGVRVARKTIEAEGICSFELVAADGRPLPAFSAGSHIDVHVPGGLVRQYSLCNDPGETHRYLIAVLDDPASRGGSRAMHAQVHEGDTLAISAPRNQFRLVPQARRHLLLAGGIGITPLLSMAESLATEGADFELHYATRSLARTAFVGRIQRSRYAARAHLHVDDGDPAQRLDLPAVLAAPAAGTHLYVCGPQGFIDAVLAQARAQGWPEAQLHVEFFGAAPVATEGDEAFEVELARSGRVIIVPAQRSVAEALLDAGVEIALSCEQGICGTCLTRVLSGLPDHRDSYLTPHEHAANDQFTPCCSRARSARLVLDL